MPFYYELVTTMDLTVWTIQVKFQRILVQHTTMRDAAYISQLLRPLIEKSHEEELEKIFQPFALEQVKGWIRSVATSLSFPLQPQGGERRLKGWLCRSFSSRLAAGREGGTSVVGGGAGSRWPGG